jgi:hypothetical protein
LNGAKNSALLPETNAALSERIDVMICTALSGRRPEDGGFAARGASVAQDVDASIQKTIT